MTRYIPAYTPPSEDYWMMLLEEGWVSHGDTPGMWEWIEYPSVSEAIWEEAEHLHDSHCVLDLVIDGLNRGGLVAHWKGVECFVPASHLADYPFPADPVTREERFKSYIGKLMHLCIIEVEPLRNRILLSERPVAECEPARPQWPAWITYGSICEGRVTSVRPFGAFVDIGPIEGMVHISEISWGRVRHPSDFLEPGQKLQVYILNVDPENQRVGLSIKRLISNPWDSVVDYIQPGDVMTGKVASVERFGIFVELVNGLEGLLHVSELTDALKPGSLYQKYEVGQAVSVRILEIIPEEHRIALGALEN